MHVEKKGSFYLFRVWVRGLHGEWHAGAARATNCAWNESYFIRSTDISLRNKTGGGVGWREREREWVQKKENTYRIPGSQQQKLDDFLIKAVIKHSFFSPLSSRKKTRFEFSERRGIGIRGLWVRDAMAQLILEND